MTSTTALPLSSRVYAVTGGASGIGAATVHELARKGAAAIWVGDWNTSNFDIIKQQVNDISPTTKIYTHKLDVSKPQDVNAWVDDIVRESGALHGAANVAGVPQTPIGLRQGSLKPTILSQDDDEWNHVLDVNLNGVFYCTRAEARAMVGMPSNIDRAIVNVASMASIVHIPGVFAYCVSKAGVAHFSVQVANDVKPFGVRCNVISPGSVNTPMSASFAGGEAALKERQANPGTEFSNMVDPAEVAKGIVWLLDEESRQVNGVNLAIGFQTP